METEVIQNSFVSVQVELISMMGDVLDAMKHAQKTMPRCEGARAFALSVTNMEQSLMWLAKVGCAGYEVPAE